MRKLLAVALLILPAVLPARQVSSPQGPGGQGARGTIQGVVKAPNSTDGIPEVTVTVISQAVAAGTAPVQLGATTDASGKFSFANLAPGRYSVRAERDGYFPAGELVPIPIAIATAPTIVNADGSSAPVTIEMERGSTISGRLRDAQGRPAAGVQIGAFRVAYQDGKKVLQPATTRTGQTTDDRGEFRIFWLPPGRYYIRTDIAPAARRGTATTSAPQSTFYPGTTDSTRAIPIDLKPGTEAAGIDFAVEYAPSFTVSGKVTISAPGGTVMPDGRVNRSVSSFYVVPQNAPAGERFQLTPNSRSVPSTDPNSAEFELRGIARGSYYIYPLFADRQAAVAAVTNLSNVYYTTRVPVDVFDQDVSGLTGDIRRNPNLTVKVVLRDPLPNGVGNPLATLRVALRAQEAMGALIDQAGSNQAQTTPDGTFVFQNVLPARYRLQLPILPNLYVADIRQGASSLYDDAIVTTTAQESSPVEITMATGGGTIRGAVRNRQAQPATGGRVVLIPQQPRRGNLLLYRRSAIQVQNGQFTMTGIAPGEYKIFAWEYLPAGAEEAAEIISEYETHGKPVSIQPGATINDLLLDTIPKAER